MSMSTGDVLVGYDGSPDADSALQWAAETAAMEGYAVRAVRVDDVVSEPEGTHGWEPDDKLPAHVDAVLASAGAEGTAERHVGILESVLVDLALEAEMLVVGSRGNGWAAQVLMGSVSQHLVRHAPCPVVVVRPPASPNADRVVVGLDGSEESLAALRFACRRARLTNEVVVALDAWEPGPVQLDHRGQLPEKLAARSAAADASLAEHVAGVQDDYPDVIIEQEPVAMAPGPALTEASANAALVVTGSRGRGVLTGLLLGSVSQHLLNHARCPVAVLRVTDHPPEGRAQ